LVKVSSQEQATVIWIVILLVLSDFAKFSTLEGLEGLATKCDQLIALNH
jgi:hypothetical protein